MAVFKTTEVWNCNPSVLVLFVGITWGLARFSGKGKFGHAVRVHLFWITCVKSVINVHKLALWQGVH